MKRDVSAHLVFTTAAATSVAMAVAAARNPGYEWLDEQLEVMIDGAPASIPELADLHGGRFHTLFLEKPAKVSIDYTATVSGTGAPADVDPMDLIRYVRPSRYCESDRLLPTSYAQFGAVEGEAFVEQVRQWVHQHLSYVSGSSRPTDGSVQTLLGRQGVCRDYAHLAISLLRAKDVPARLVSVYAPGLSPMDFHAVVEAYVGGAWQIIDATGLAPRGSLVRIATGRDAADTAFLSTTGGSLKLEEFTVTAVVDELPNDVGGGLTQLR